MNFELTQKQNIGEFIEIFKFIKNLSDYVTFSCSDQGINIQVMDSSHVSLLDINIKNTWFVVYSCKEPYIFSLYNNDLVKILKTVSAKVEYLKCDVDDEHFNIHFMHKDYEKHYQLNEIDIEQELMGCEDYETDLDFKISLSVLDEYMGSIFGEDIEIKCKNDVLYLISYDEKNQKTNITLKTDRLEEFNVVDDYDETFKISANYMMYIAKFKKMDNVHVYLNEDKPVFFHMVKDGFDFRYYVAMKTEDTD